MSKKLFLDINIIIDILDEARLHHLDAQQTLVKIIDEDYQVYVSEDMITTIYYILKGNVKVLYFFKSIIKKWNIVPFGKDVIEESIDFAIKNGSDLEDTLQCMCVKKQTCDIFLTSDKKFVDCGITAMTYNQFLSN